MRKNGKGQPTAAQFDELLAERDELAAKLDEKESKVRSLASQLGKARKESGDEQPRDIPRGTRSRVKQPGDTHRAPRTRRLA